MSSFTAEKQPRPQFRNLNFPLLLTYRLPLPGLVSIMHRISGAALFLMLPLLLWLFDLSLMSELSFERLRSDRLQLLLQAVARVSDLGVSFTTWSLAFATCCSICTSALT